MNISNYPGERTSPALPAGYTIRSATIDDLEVCVTLFNLISTRDYGRNTYAADDVLTEWTSPSFDLAANTRILHDESGNLAGYIEVQAKPPERPFIWARVHPDHENRGLGTYLIRWGESIAHQNLPQAAEGAQVLVHMAYKHGHTATETLFTDLGYQHIRNFYDMWIDLDDAPAPVTLPDGFSLRPYNHPQDLRDILKVTEEAFSDHWGHVDEDFEETYKEVLHEFDNDDKFDPSLVLVVTEDATGTIAGVAYNRIESYSHPEAGYINTLGVPRAYRNRGIGTTLLKHTFYEMYKRGKRAVTLGVDASNLTGAVRLYENAGMYAKETFAVYEKIIREGQPVMVS
jgi:mycothiol synthase